MPGSIRRFTRAENQRVMPVLIEEARMRMGITGDTFEECLDVVVDYYDAEGGKLLSPVEVILDSKNDMEDIRRRQAEDEY